MNSMTLSNLWKINLNTLYQHRNRRGWGGSHLSRTAGQWNRRHRRICWVRCSARHSGSHSHIQLQDAEDRRVNYTLSFSFLSPTKIFHKASMTSPSTKLYHQCCCAPYACFTNICEDFQWWHQFLSQFVSHFKLCTDSDIMTSLTEIYCLFCLTTYLTIALF